MANSTAEFSSLRTRGFQLVEGMLSRGKVDRCLEALRETDKLGGVRRRGGETFACRHLLWDLPGLGSLLTDVGLDALASRVLGREAFPVAATLFDKVQGANWKVPSHQDRAVPVVEKVEVPGFTQWSVKIGIPYVEPPAEVLEQLVALRVHLDDCPVENGALAVVPGSHERGRLADADVSDLLDGAFETCSAASGDVLLMKPLAVHRSLPAESATHRRVLHALYATQELPGGLHWRRGV